MNIAFVPMRIGSKSIPKKNIIDFCGKPLCYWSIKALQFSDAIDEIVIAYDSDLIADVVKSFNFNKIKYYKRNPENANDLSSTESVILEYLEKSNLRKDDVFILVQVTNPFLKNKEISDALKKYSDLKYTGSIISCASYKRFLWSCNKPQNYDPYNRPRRQDFEGVSVENGAFYINTVNSIINSKNRLTKPFYTFDMTEESIIEIDEPSDIIVAEKLFTKNGFIEKTTNHNFKIIFSDVDGVLTDGSMYYTENGDELKRFSTYDGVGFSLFAKKGLKTGLITSELTKIVDNRAKKMKLDYCIQNVHGIGKLKACQDICNTLNIDIKEVIYIGDDVNCIELLKKVGFAACPSNAVKEVKEIQGISILNKTGGNGVIRELFDKIYR